MRKPGSASLRAASAALALAIGPSVAGATPPSGPPCMVRDPDRFVAEGRASPTVAAFEREGWTIQRCQASCEWQFVEVICLARAPESFASADVHADLTVLYPADNPQSVEIARRWARFPEVWAERLRDPRIVDFVRVVGLGNVEIRPANRFAYPLDRDQPDRGPWFWVQMGSLRWREEAYANRERANGLDFELAPGRLRVTGLMLRGTRLIELLPRFLPQATPKALACASEKRAVGLREDWSGAGRLRGYQSDDLHPVACEVPVALEPPINPHPDRAFNRP